MMMTMMMMDDDGRPRAELIHPFEAALNYRELSVKYLTASNRVSF
jgi:hypothetical protein